MKPLVQIRLRLLGRFALSLAGDRADSIKLSTRKAGALLAYLAMNPEQTASREELATLLWGGCSDQQARQSLRQALALLRKELGQSYFFTANNEVVRLQDGLWSVDACEFDNLTRSSRAEDLERAGQLFGGQFLSGLNIEEEGFEEWVRGQRQRMQMAASRLCESYATRPELVANGQLAVAAADRLLALDPLREDWQRLALTLYARYRGRTEALAQAEAFAAALQRELGVVPEKETRALIGKIQSGEIGPAASEPNPVKTDAVAPVGAHSVEPALANSAGAPASGQHGAPAEDVSPLSSPVPRPASRARLGIIGALALGCLIVAAGIFGLTHGRSVAVHAGDPTAQVPAETRIAPADSWQSPTNGLQNAAIAARANERVIPMIVLPFASDVEDASSNPSLADRVTDDLINVLSRVYRLRMISRNTSQQYKGKPVDAAALGSELGVRYVLEGSVRTHGGRLRVNAELIDTATRLAVWSDQIEYEQVDHNAVADEIVIRIGHVLQVETQVIEVRRAGERPGAVYQLVDKGWVTIFAGPGTLDRLNAGKVLFEQALRQDPNSLAAKTGLAAYHVEVVSEVLVSDPAPHTEEALKLLRTVVAEDPRAATAYYYLARAQRNANDFSAALRSFARAIELNPSYTSAHAQVGLTLMFMRRPADALAHILYAMRLSPKDRALPFWMRFAAEAELSLGHDAQAVTYLERSLEMAPKQLRTWGALAAVQALSGKTAAARKAVAKVRELAGGSSDSALLQRLGRLDRLGPNRLHDGLKMALALGSETLGSETLGGETLGGEIDPWQSPRPPGQPSEDAPSKQPSGLAAMVVMPFTIAGEGGDAPDLLADVMTDDLTNVLSRVGGLRVISRQTAQSYRGQRVDPAAIGAELGVRYLLEGSVSTRGDRLNVNVELIDAKSRQRVWTGRYDRSGADRNAITDEIVNGLGRELQIEVFLTEGERDPKDPDLHALIFKGWNAINASGKAGVDSLRQAEKYFTQALERSPNNFRAQNGLAAYHAHMAIQLYSADPVADLVKATAILRQLIERDPNANGPHAVMGLVHVAREEMNEAARSFERSIALSPSHVLSHAQLGRALVRLGRPQEGLEHVLYAMRLSPRDPAMGFFLAFAGSAELELKRYAKAIDYFDRALVHNPGQPRTLLSRVAAHALSGNISEARLQLERLRQARPHLSREKLIGLYARSAPDSQLRQGIHLALAQPADPWQPPPLPPEHRSDDTGRRKGPITAIAILPFTTYGETAGSIQTIADVITDDLTNNLSRVSLLRVISRQTMRSYLGEKIDIAALGSQLGVRYVLEGNIRMHGDMLRVNVELIDPATRLPVWSARIERDRADQYAVQDEIVGRLARELHFQVYHAVSARASKDRSATELIYTGWAAILDHGTEGIGALQRAEAAFMQARERDPGNRSSNAGLGAYHTLVGSLQLVPDWRAHLVKAEELVRQSIREVPEGAAQHFYLSIIQRMRGELKGALESLAHCLEIAPSMAPCHAHLGHTLVQMNRAGEGIEHVNYALRLSPRDMSRPHWLRFAGEAEIELGQFERAIALLQRSYDANPRQPRTLRSLAAAHALSGNPNEAHKYLAELKASAPHLSPEDYLRRPQPLEGTQPELVRGLRQALAALAEIRAPRSAAAGTTPLTPIP